MCREVFKKFKACLTIKAINDYRQAYDAINIIYKSLQEDVEKADISDIMRELHAIVEDSIKIDDENSEGNKLYDISKINFEKLRKEFGRSPSKNTTVHTLKDIIEKKLLKMLIQKSMMMEFFFTKIQLPPPELPKMRIPYHMHL